MRVGRYLRAAKLQYFVAWQDKLVNWEDLARASKPRQITARLRETIQDGSMESFCSILPYLDDLSRDIEELAREIGKPIDGQLEPPVLPRNFICIGLNYFDHAREASMEVPKEPILFAKTPNALSGHHAAVRIPPNTSQVDYEAELGVVIGRTCTRVQAKDANHAIAGYVCANDVSARDFQFGDGQWYRGKSADTFGPIGPWLVTTSEIHDPHSLQIKCRLNGRTMQDSNTSNLIFGVPELIEFISRSITLTAGDVVLTGTPPGVGFARKPPVFLRRGDRIEVEIEKIGTLTNVVEDGS